MLPGGAFPEPGAQSPSENDASGLVIAIVTVSCCHGGCGGLDAVVMVVEVLMVAHRVVVVMVVSGTDRCCPAFLVPLLLS